MFQSLRQTKSGLWLVNLEGDYTRLDELRPEQVYIAPNDTNPFYLITWDWKKT